MLRKQPTQICAQDAEKGKHRGMNSRRILRSGDSRRKRVFGFATNIYIAFHLLGIYLSRPFGTCGAGARCCVTVTS